MRQYDIKQKNEASALHKTSKLDHIDDGQD